MTAIYFGCGREVYLNFLKLKCSIERKKNRICIDCSINLGTYTTEFDRYVIARNNIEIIVFLQLELTLIDEKLVTFFQSFRIAHVSVDWRFLSAHHFSISHFQFRGKIDILCQEILFVHCSWTHFRGKIIEQKISLIPFTSFDLK